MMEYKKIKIQRVILNSNNKVGLQLYIEYINNDIIVSQYINDVFYNKGLTLKNTPENKHHIENLINDCLNHGYTKKCDVIEKWI